MKVLPLLFFLLPSCSLLFTQAADNKVPKAPIPLVVRSAGTKVFDLGNGILHQLTKLDPRIKNFDYQNWTWSESGKLVYSPQTIAYKGQQASVLKGTATITGPSGFAVKMDALDASAYTKLKVTYYLSNPAVSLKFKIVSTSGDSGDITSLPNQPGWNEWETGLTSLGTLDPAAIKQIAFIYEANKVGDYLAWGDLYFIVKK